MAKTRKIKVKSGKTVKRAAELTGRTKSSRLGDIGPLEDAIRDLTNLISVYKQEEMEGVSTRIEPRTAQELIAKLEDLAKMVAMRC